MNQFVGKSLEQLNQSLLESVEITENQNITNFDIKAIEDQANILEAYGYEYLKLADEQRNLLRATKAYRGIVD